MKNSMRLRVAKTATAVPLTRGEGKLQEVNVFKAAHLLNVHWTRIYALLRENRLDPERVVKEGRQTWIKVSAINDYRDRRDWWMSLHGGGKEIVAASR